VKKVTAREDGERQYLVEHLGLLAMFQQPRNIHPMESMDFIMHQKMSERMISSHQQMQPPLNPESSGTNSNKRSRVDQIVNSGYEHPPMVNFYPVADPATSSVVLTRTEYEAMRQEIVVLKRTLTEFRGTVDTEIETLKKENKLLKRQVRLLFLLLALHMVMCSLAANQSTFKICHITKLYFNWLGVGKQHL